MTLLRSLGRFRIVLALGNIFYWDKIILSHDIFILFTNIILADLTRRILQ